MPFRLTPDVEVKRDADGVVRKIRHPRQAYAAQDSEALLESLAPGETPSPRQLADEYLREVLPVFDLGVEMADELSAPIGLEAIAEAPKLRYLEQKEAGNQAIVSYAQTELGLPVWRQGVAVKLAGAPFRVIGASNSVQTGIAAAPPSPDAPYLPDRVDSEVLAGLLGTAGEKRPIVNRTRLLVYQLDPNDRGNAVGEPADSDERQAHVAGPVMPLPDLPDELESGRYYVVTEVLFTLEAAGWGEVNWGAFIEPSTGAVLRLDSFVGCVDALVYDRDPLTRTGDTSIRPDSPAARLDAQRERVTLAGLANPGPPPARHELRGAFVHVRDITPPNSAPPTVAQGNDFDYSVPTDDFAAVNAYYHCDRLFRMLDEMGFDVANYFDGTTFPVRVDHRVSYPDRFGIPQSNVVNASAPGNVTRDGSDGFRFALLQRNTNVGIALEWRVVLHEFGHTILWDHLDSPNFRFAHSAGDTLAAILNDPGSQAPDRFETFPWTPIRRRHDRRVEDGWGWGGSFDDPFPVGHPLSSDRAGYQREQILSSTLFRFYRAIGGEHTDVALRNQVSRFAAFLIFSAVGVLSTVSPPANAEDFADGLIDADLGLDNFEGLAGGAVHKVIRWAFEQQGSYQPPGAPRPVFAAGAPPEVDVYIDDGRGGGYAPRDHFVFSSADIWNRRAADGGTLHEEPVSGQPNALYVRVKNRGTRPANNVRVEAHFTADLGERPWPTVWTPLDTPSLAAGGAITPAGETIVGPFAWSPASEGPLAILCSASADGDASNANTLSTALSAARLAHCDNNVAGRLLTVAATIAGPVGDSEIRVETQPRLAIPDADPAGVVSELPVSGSGVIASLEVSVTIVHTYRGDLRVSLTSPAGTTALLFQGRLGDSVSNLIATFTSADGGDLQAIVGENPAGTWRLRVIDQFGLDLGTLERWGLVIGLQ